MTLINNTEINENFIVLASKNRSTGYFHKKVWVYQQDIFFSSYARLRLAGKSGKLPYGCAGTWPNAQNTSVQRKGTCLIAAVSRVLLNSAFAYKRTTEWRKYWPSAMISTNHNKSSPVFVIRWNKGWTFNDPVFWCILPCKQHYLVEGSQKYSLHCFLADCITQVDWSIFLNRKLNCMDFLRRWRQIQSLQGLGKIQKKTLLYCPCGFGAEDKCRELRYH